MAGGSCPTRGGVVGMMAVLVDAIGLEGLGDCMTNGSQSSEPDAHNADCEIVRISINDKGQKLCLPELVYA